MRRYAAAFALLTLLVAAPLVSRPAHAAPAPGHATAALSICLFNDPATVVNATLWALRALTRLVAFADEIVEHLKQDVRRAQGQPQGVPVVVPIRPPDLPESLPTPRRPPLRSARPEPITDTLPVRSPS